MKTSKLTGFLSDTQKMLVDEAFEFYIKPLLGNLMQEEQWIETGCRILWELINNNDEALIKELTEEFYNEEVVNSLRVTHKLIFCKISEKDPWLAAVFDARLGHKIEFTQEEKQEVGLIICRSIDDWLHNHYPSVMEKIKADSEFKGVSQAHSGLSQLSIESNLDILITSNRTNKNCSIHPQLLNSCQVKYYLNQWQKSEGVTCHYAALVGIENERGEKHVVLLTANRRNHREINIVIIDPLPKKHSTFTGVMKHLAVDLSELGKTALSYAGCQNKEEGTCGDLSLLMLQGWIERPRASKINSFSFFLPKIPSLYCPDGLLLEQELPSLSLSAD